MIDLKQLVYEDRSLEFLNLHEFGEIHVVNGERIQCLIDSDTDTPKLAYEGITSNAIRLFVRAEDLERQEAGTQLEIDGDLYEVLYWNDDMGLYTIGLASYRG